MCAGLLKFNWKLISHMPNKICKSKNEKKTTTKANNNHNNKSKGYSKEYNSLVSTPVFISYYILVSPSVAIIGC